MLLVAALALFCCLLAACRGSTHTGSSPGPGPSVVRAATQGDPRSVLLGFDAIPPAQTSDAYIQTFATAAKYADAIVIQRTPPWADFLPGATVSQATQATTQLETGLLRQYKNLSLVYVIDPTDASVQRSRIANLPPGVDPAKGFLDPRLQSAFNAYVTYVVSNYHPAYLGLGAEINMLYERNRPQFDAFVTLYKQAYSVAKAARPSTKVFPTFQLEDLLGDGSTPHPPHWEVFDSFSGMMDALAVTTYPYLGGFSSAADIPANYYSQLRQHFNGPILITAAGYPSAPVDGQPVVGTEQDQQAFLNRLLGDAERSRFTLVAWAAARDPNYAVTGTTIAYKDIGLRRSDGANKLAWAVWEQWARRPLKASGP